MRDAGASEVHMRIAAPPIKFPCYFGVDIPTKEELIANKIQSEDIREISIGVKKLIDADSLYYLGINCIKKIMEDCLF